MGIERSRTDVLVVGADQAGLAMARALAAAGIAFRVQERWPRIGDAWRRRFDSLVLFSPRAMNALPDVPLSGDPQGYPSKDEIADYLERYAERLALPVTTGDGVARLARNASRFLAVTETGREVEARAVVIASGAFQRPFIPRFAAGLSDAVRQLDATTYRRPHSVAEQRVAVIGDGATGRQIALELAAAGYDVTLATGRRRNFGPQRMFGQDATWRALTEERGVSPVPGLFYVGREWQSCRASALLCGVHRDAAVIASRVERFLALWPCPRAPASTS